MRTAKLMVLAAFVIGGCATAGKPVEKGDESEAQTEAAAKNESAPKPPSADQIAQQKKQQEQAQKAAPKLSASVKAEFDGAVKKWQAARAAKGGIGPGDCKSLAGNFSGIRDPQLAAQAHFNAGTILEG